MGARNPWGQCTLVRLVFGPRAGQRISRAPWTTRHGPSGVPRECARQFQIIDELLNTVTSLCVCLGVFLTSARAAQCCETRARYESDSRDTRASTRGLLSSASRFSPGFES